MLTFSQKKTFIDGDPQIGVCPQRCSKISFPKKWIEKLTNLKPGYELLLGRSEFCGIPEILDGMLTSISRRHATLYFDGRDYILKDIFSKLGTLLLRGEQIIPIGHAGRRLLSGDLICLGEAPPITFVHPHGEEKIGRETRTVEEGSLSHFILLNEQAVLKFKKAHKQGLAVLGRGDILSMEEDYYSRISREHAIIRYEDGFFSIADKGSSYGTVLVHNGAILPIGREARQLKEGDLIQLGDAPLVLMKDVLITEEELIPRETNAPLILF